jgi:hypothetical protein
MAIGVPVLTKPTPGIFRKNTALRRSLRPWLRPGWGAKPIRTGYGLIVFRVPEQARR